MSHPPSSLSKFGIVHQSAPGAASWSGEDPKRPYAYPNTFVRETTSDGAERLVIGPAEHAVALLADLADRLPSPLRLLYVLVAPRVDGVEPGRYEAPDALTHEELRTLLDEFAPFFEGDGRHHVWVSHPGHGLLVYDRHNVLYAYGPLDTFVEVLTARGLRPGPVDIPSPHWHAYHDEYDATLARLLDRWPWVLKPLGPNDE